MTQSIEKIWKKGFLRSDALVAPTLNDLYDQKSKHTIDRFLRMGKINLIGIAVMAIAILLGSILIGAPYIGGFISILLAVAVLFGSKQLGKMKQLDNSLDSYHYLKSFDNFLTETMASYTRMYRFVYPACVLAVFQGIWSLGGYSERILSENPDAYLVNGVPIPMLIGALSVAGLMALFAGPIYRLDVYFVYGRIFRKLREILVDMEELRS